MSTDVRLDRSLEDDARSARSRPEVAATAAPALGLVSRPEAFLRLQRLGGNAMVMQLLRAGSASTAGPPLHMALGRGGHQPSRSFVQREGEADETETGAGSTSGESAAELAPAGSETSAAGAGSSSSGDSAGAPSGEPDSDESASDETSEAGAAAQTTASSASGLAGAAGGASAGPSASAPGGPAGGAEAGMSGEPPRDHGLSPEEVEAKQSEGEEGSESDVMVNTAGGDYPAAGSDDHTGHGFTTGGRTGSVPICNAVMDTLVSGKPDYPRAFVGGGSTGTKAWAGGGGAGPKGNQQAGSIQTQVPPEYESNWGGLFSDANAWVKEGTGVADVKRDYVTSNAGDQGNGWYVSDRAAAALTAHEQRHVNASRSAYDSHIKPVTERIGRSRQIGAGVFYRQENARAWVKQQVGWEKGLKNFSEEDIGQNNPNAMIDGLDYGSANYPRNVPGGKVAGKDYTTFLIMNNEPNPT